MMFLGPRLNRLGDALIRVTKAAICGSDLHVVHGRIPGMRPGRVLGHKFVSVVEATTAAVTRFAEWDRVVGSFTIPCGDCWYCERRYFNRCPEQRVFGYGSFFGDVEGAQAEYVRVPSADLVLHHLDVWLSDEQGIFAGDIFTTGLSFGAIPVDAHAAHAPSFIQDQTGGRGADAVLECVGAVPALLDCIDIARARGRISVIGVHSDQELVLPLNTTFIKGIDLKSCGTANIVGRWDEALAMLSSGTVRPEAIISHRMALDDAVLDYELFQRREALKVVLTP
jgi:threonine dehydrogenase-like Zn-dependent dehydrogenase